MNSLCEETISPLSSKPLFSCIVTFCTLVFLYLPHLFLNIVLSPVLIPTGILLLTILRIGAIQKYQHEQKENQHKPEPVFITKEENRGSRGEKQSSSPIEPNETKSLYQVNQRINSQKGLESRSFFVEWNMKAPLEVIYEEYEGEEEEPNENEYEGEEEEPNENEEKWNMGVHSLSHYYPETDSDTSSENGFPATWDWDSSENICFRWDDDEEEREGLIEIALDKKRDLKFHFEEENLIEIDISPTRYKELSGEYEVFSGPDSSDLAETKSGIFPQSGSLDLLK